MYMYVRKILGFYFQQLGVSRGSKSLGNFEHFSKLLSEIISIDPFLKKNDFRLPITKGEI